MSYNGSLSTRTSWKEERFSWSYKTPQGDVQRGCGQLAGLVAFLSHSQVLCLFFPELLSFCRADSLLYCSASTPSCSLLLFLNISRNY